MEDDAKCIHGMEDGCSICRGRDVCRSEPEGVAYYYPAKYEGQCPECNLDRRGPAVRQDDEGRNLHNDCLP